MANPVRRKARSVRSFFPEKPCEQQAFKKRRRCDDKAEALARRLDAKPTYMTEDGNSWYILVKAWLCPSTEDDFEEEWSLHPVDRKPLRLYGRTVYEKRWSQSWGMSYAYSGSVSVAKPIKEDTISSKLLLRANELTRDLFMDNDSSEATTSPYNGCLQNWYEPADTMGLHSDDESSLRHEFPIFSLSWGGTRRFLFRSKSEQPTKKIELLLDDGDLLVMGGTCQVTHRHEVPKLRVTMDPPTSRRINWTVRAFHVSV